MRTGHGIYLYKKGGHRYEGKWKENHKHGIGKMEYRKKGTYFGRLFSDPGYFQNSRRHGEGVFTYPNGDTYSGNWKWGKKQGRGTYIYKDTGMKVDNL